MGKNQAFSHHFSRIVANYRRLNPIHRAYTPAPRVFAYRKQSCWRKVAICFINVFGNLKIGKMAIKNRGLPDEEFCWLPL